MLIVVTGGSGSGKSEYAENLAMTLGEKRIYAATMMVYGEEGRQRVKRHRKMREHKQFHTVECPVNLETIVDSQDIGEAVVLLECMSNLVANEMFSVDGGDRTGDWIFGKIMEGMRTVISRCRHLVVVTNEVFSDGIPYSLETEAYIRVLGRINRELAAMADHMTEVVCGIPVDDPDRKGKELV